MLELVFFILAGITVLSAFGVIIVRDIFRAALCLILLFMAVAGLYFLLHADFLGVVQILVYVGAVSILIIVAIMLTRDARQGQPLGSIKYVAGIFALLLLGTILYGVVNAGFHVNSASVVEPTVAPLGQKLFGDGGYLITVEMAAVLLLSAMLGAIVILREK